MTKTGKNITDSEYELMQVMWKSGVPLTSAEILNSIKGKKWKITTVSTLLMRLVDKGAASFEKRGRNHYYSPVLKESDYKLNATKSLLSKIYNGSVKNLVAALYENEEITDNEIDELKKMFDL